MFRRPRPAAPNTPPEVQPPAAPAAVPEADPARVLGELLARPNLTAVLEQALAQAAALLGGEVRGFAVIRRGQDQVVGVLGYPRTLVGQTLGGPWSAMRPRILSGGSSELYAANSEEIRTVLDNAGMREVPVSLVVPLSERGRQLGALVLDRAPGGGGTVTPQQQEAVARWAQAVTPLLGLLESREEWQRTARQLAASVVEAVESQEFESLGHARAVAEISQELGRALGLTERELEELWFAATLHDLGKLHGEEGHALVGANFLHGVPHLAEAQKAIRHHHERWDGQGEPDKLVGEDIPLYARILAVANAYVRTGDLERVRAQAGKGLDARLVAALEKAEKRAR